MKTKIISFVLALLMVLSLTSCGVSKADKEEIISAAKELITASYEINEIYFGKGLKTTGKEVLVHTEFEYVDETTGYGSIAVLKEATSKVYTEDYCNDYLYVMAFEGIKSSDDEESAISFPRFREDTKGRLCQIKSAKEDGADLKRTYDFDSIKVESYVRGVATIKIMSLVDGKADETTGEITLKLVKQADGWRLDSPTY